MVAAMRHGILWVYHKTHWFTDAEAWAVFRFFAIGETITWTLLISGIIYRRLELPEAASVVSFAGHIHGIMMVLYCIIIVVVARSMRWGIIRMVLAVGAGVPPFGSLVFEKIMAYRRKKYPVYVQPPVGYDE